MTKNLATHYINLGLRWLPRKLALVWKVTQPGINLDLTCQHINGFVWFDSLRPINNLSVIKGRVFLVWTSTKLGLMFLLKDTKQWCRWGSNPQPFSLESSTLPLSHTHQWWVMIIKYSEDMYVKIFLIKNLLYAITRFILWIVDMLMPQKLGQPA